MKFLLLAIVLAVCSATLTHHKVILAAKDGIVGEYIVVFHNNITAEKRSSHIAARGSVVTSVYEIGNSFFGYAAKLNDRDLALVSRADEVDFIEQNQMMHAIQSCSTQTGATWGIDRIGEKKINLDGKYVYPTNAGTGVDAYIIDTGIYTTHNDFGGRAVVGVNYVTGESSQDCNGHGTHVAGTVGGKTYGVAKNVNLIAVKVLGCSGSGTNQGVINGINWVANAYQSSKRPSVANMSLGGGKSTATNNAVAAAVKAGVTMVVAAGNDNADACNYSPASELTAISVGATENANNGGSSIDARSTFSNFGTCVSIFAPGTLITSDWFGSNTGIKTISGTSMAAPHVAGAAAVYLTKTPSATPAQVKSHLVSTSGSNEIDLECGSNTACAKSPNKFVYSPCA